MAFPDRSQYHFEHNWFELIRPEWERLTSPLRDGRRLRVLEIGSFEGASTTFILDNLLSHPESHMVAIDSFQGGMEHREDPANEPKHSEHDASETPSQSKYSRARDPKEYDLSTLERRFMSNVRQSNNFDKLKVMKALSQNALVTLVQEQAEFDFIYVDGSHVAFDVLHDAVLCWRMLALGGTLVFDDYAWKGYNEDVYNPRVAISAFAKCVENAAEPCETESQLWLKKVPNRVKPTRNEDESLYYWDRPTWQMTT